MNAFLEWCGNHPGIIFGVLSILSTTCMTTKWTVSGVIKRIKDKGGMNMLQTQLLSKITKKVITVQIEVPDIMYECYTNTKSNDVLVGTILTSLQMGLGNVELIEEKVSSDLVSSKGEYYGKESKY